MDQDIIQIQKYIRLVCAQYFSILYIYKLYYDHIKYHTCRMYNIAND